MSQYDTAPCGSGKPAVTRVHEQERSVDSSPEDRPTENTPVELRIHDVSGTPPDKRLECPKEFIEMVIGDRNAGFYRRREGLDQILADGNAATTGVDIVESPSLMSVAVLYPTSP
jgi:hypothetical protein